MLKIDYLIKDVDKLMQYNNLLFLYTDSESWGFLQNFLKTFKSLSKSICSPKMEHLVDIHLKYGKKIDNYIFMNNNQMYMVNFKSKENNPEIISWQDLTYELDGMNSFDPSILIFDNKSEKKQIQLLLNQGYKFRFIYGDMKDQEIDYYTLWLDTRNKVEKIIFTVELANTKVEVFQWVQGEFEKELSIILPIYNVEKYLHECFKSIASWDVDFVEFLAINDGSPDNSLAVLEELAAVDPRIRIISKPNGGCASARQMGLDLAQGRYVGLIDPDDFTKKDMFMKLHRRAMLGQYEVSYCGYLEYYESDQTSKQVKQDLIYEPYSNGTTNENEIRKLITDLKVGIWRGIYQKDFLTRENIYFNTELRRFDDLPFKIEVFAKARSVVSIPDFMYFYRLQRPGQDVAISDDRLYVHFDIFDYIHSKIDKNQELQLHDYIQIVKSDTHSWALNKIDKEYYKEYVRKMKKDLSKIGFMRNAILSWGMRGRKKVVSYSLLYLGYYSVLNTIHGRESRSQVSKKRKYEESRKKLEQYYR